MQVGDILGCLSAAAGYAPAAGRTVAPATGGGRSSADRAEISETGRQALAAEESGQDQRQDEDGKPTASPRPQSPSEAELTDLELRQVRDLQTRDREVRAHEQAHIAASGGLARGGASFSFQVGPDGKRYAVGGEVSIDTGTAGSPEATIARMQAVRRAALAPANPGATDRAVAAQARGVEARARLEMLAARMAEAKRSDEAEPADAAASETAPAEETADDEETERTEDDAPPRLKAVVPTLGPDGRPAGVDLRI